MLTTQARDTSQDNHPQEERRTLPPDLFAWRKSGSDLTGKAEENIWGDLRSFFESRGYTYWHVVFPGSAMQALQGPPTKQLVCNGFEYASLERGWKSSDISASSYEMLLQFQRANPLCRAARAADGRDVVIRVLAVGTHGRSHADVLKLLSRNHYGVIDRNHAIPVLEFLDYQDMTFAIFPKVGFSLSHAYGLWANNSVGDLVDMILQCVEALDFIHYVGVAHMDAFRDNFLIQFFPESLERNQIAVTRPRVYLNDFETAIYFAPDVPREKRVCVGLPSGGSWRANTEEYARPTPPELFSDAPYDPHKLDVWQLATSFVSLTTTIPSIDHIMEAMRCPDASSRLSSREALTQLVEAVASLPPQSLLIPPVVASPEF